MVFGVWGGAPAEKTHRHLLDSVASQENLHAAWLLARRGRRYGARPARFEIDAESHLLRLEQELRSGAYRPGRYRLLTIREPKRRVIAAAPFRDRVVHHALCRVLVPLLARSFIHDTYACLPGRGTHRVVLRHLELSRRYRYRCHLDVRAFFASIRVDLLLELVARSIRDRQVLELLGAILESGLYIYRQERLMRHLGLEAHPPGDRRGLPVGNLTSQHLANFFLDGLDHLVKRDLKLRGYLRYMDDMVLFADDRRALVASAETITRGSPAASPPGEGSGCSWALRAPTPDHRLASMPLGGSGGRRLQSWLPDTGIIPRLAHRSRASRLIRMPNSTPTTGSGASLAIFLHRRSKAPTSLLVARVLTSISTSTVSRPRLPLPSRSISKLWPSISSSRFSRRSTRISCSRCRKPGSRVSPRSSRPTPRSSPRRWTVLARACRDLSVLAWAWARFSWAWVRRSTLPDSLVSASLSSVKSSRCTPTSRIRWSTIRVTASSVAGSSLVSSASISSTPSRILTRGAGAGQ
ncbi:MAG: RNA-directed DNA polymerase [Deltaproteobacteria bacterium]|nr:RNA-directed DNA polymerase [Deltaproteobacteria bacterium]